MKKLYMDFFICLVISLSPLIGLTEARTNDEKNNIEVYKKSSPGVVNISSVVVEYDSYYRPIPKEGTGSGVIIDELGYIVTNNHVIQDSRRLEVTLSDGSKWNAVLIGADPENDLAVVKISVSGKKLKALTFGNSKDLKVGQKVLAIGNPFGLGQTLTAGVISSLQRSIQTGTGSIIRNAIQTDAAVNPGNSGGPMLNSEGEIIGINTMILSPTGASVGVSFAVPIEVVKRVVPQIVSGRSSYYGIMPLVYLGLVFLALHIFWRQFERRRQ